MDWRRAMGLGLAAALALSAGAARAAVGDAPALDTLPNGASPGDLFPGRVAPGAPAPERRASGNPLWAIPLSSLTATRERPIFLPSRRPPAPVIAGPMRIEPPPPPPAAPERPKLTFVGAVVGDSGGIAVFYDSANEAIRVRTGQDYAGWVLNSLKGREATFEKDGETAVFAMPVPGATTPSVPPAPVVTAPAPGVPVASPGAVSEPALRPSTLGAFAPFVPRSTPKNGESDGL